MIESQPYLTGKAEAKALIVAQRVPIRPMLLGLLVWLGPWLALYSFCIWVAHQYVSVTAPVAFACLAVSLTVSVPFFIWARRTIARSMLRWGRTQMPAAQFDQQRFSADADGFLLSSAFSEMHCKWQIVQQIIDTPTHIVLKITPLNVYVLPKSALGNDAAQAAAVEQMRAWWLARRVDTSAATNAGN